MAIGCSSRGLYSLFVHKSQLMCNILRSSPMKSRLKDDMGKLPNLTEYTLRIHKKYYPSKFVAVEVNRYNRVACLD